MTLLKKLTVVMLIGAMTIVTGCGNKTAPQASNNNGNEVIEASADMQQVNASSLVEQLQQKYSSVETTQYYDKVIYVEQDEPITFQLGFNPRDNGMWDRDVFDLYYTNDFAVSHINDVFVSTTNSGEMTISPQLGMGLIEKSNIMTYADISDLNGGYIKEYSEENYGKQNWGNFDHFYLAQKYDFETGELLENLLST